VTLEEAVVSIEGRPWREADWACWDLVRFLQEFFNRSLPLIEGKLANTHFGLVRAFAFHPERENWVLDKPQHGSIVLMTRNDAGRKKEVHAGVRLVLDRPLIAHVDEPHGTVLDTEAIIHTRGWHTLNYYRHI
jgi:hypothetical protein